MTRGYAGSKVDITHPAIVAELRKNGYFVISLAPLGGGVPDLLVPSKTDPSRVMLIEAKTGNEPLNSNEVKWHAAYPGRVEIARSPEQAVEIMQEFDDEDAQELDTINDLQAALAVADLKLSEANAKLTQIKVIAECRGDEPILAILEGE